MLQEVSQTLATVGLRLNYTKLKWMANKYANLQPSDYLKLDNVYIPRVDNFEVLGCILSANISEKEAFAHRTQKTWNVFHKWAHILCCSAPLPARLKFWRKVVEPSMLWGLQTCRKPTGKMLSAVSHAQHSMVRKMMKTRKQPNEQWLEWHRRTLGLARDVLVSHRMHVGQLLDISRERWAGHLIRLGNKSGDVHVVKFILAWRPLKWWRSQQLYNAVTLEPPVLHPSDWGLPRRWEESLQADWMLDFSEE